MATHKTGTREQWLVARLELLKAGKELTRRNDELARQLRELPWVPVEKQYTFRTSDGPRGLANCSTAARSWWSTTSCSALATRLDAPPARRSLTALTAYSPTSRLAT